MALSTILSACGGGGKGPEVSKEAALNACEPSSGPVGTQVVCTVKGMTADATLFFDGKPVEYILNEEDGAVSLTVPPSLPGSKSIYSQEGDSGANPIGSFEISGNEGASGGTVTPPPSTPPAPTGEEGETITPSGSGTGGTTTGVDAGGTTGGTSGGTTGSGTTGGLPPVTGVTATLAVNKQFSTRFGLVDLHWNVTATEEISELYIYGSFYRIEADGTASNPCGKIDDAYGKRSLLVHSNGDDLNVPSPNFDIWNKYMGSAKLCTDSNNCHGYTAPVSLNDPDGGKYETRKLLALNYKMTPDLIEQDAGVLKYAIPDLLFADNPPYCRIDLKKDGAFVKSGDLYTRLLTRNPFTLYVKTSSGADKVVTSSAPDLPVANITASAEVLTDKPKIKFTANYGYALLPATAPAGCTSPAVTYNPNGSGSVTAECPLNKSQQLTVSAVGIGKAGAASETFKIESTAVQKELKPTTFYEEGSSLATCEAGAADWWKSCPKKGDLKLFGYATRTWTVSQKKGSNWETVGSPKTTPWIMGMEIKGYKYDGSSCGTSGFKAITDMKTLPNGVSIAVDGRLLLQAKLPRNHGCTHYELEALDLDSSSTGKESVDAPYDAEFDISNGSTHGAYNCLVDDCDEWGESDCCDGNCDQCPSSLVHDCTDHTSSGSFNWSGRHIKHVESTCGGTFNGGQPDNGNYDLQTGDWTNSVGGKSMECDIKATTWDDQIITRHFGFSWNDNC